MNANDRLVYVILALRADERGKCFPSVKRICEDTGMGKTTVVKSLKKMGVLGIISKNPRRPNHCSEYYVRDITKGV